MPALLVDAQIASIFWGDVPIPIDCGWIKSTVNPSRGRVGISNAPTMTPGPRQNNIVPFSRWTNHRRLSVNNVTTMTSISETCHFGEASHRWASLLQRIRGNVRPHRVCRTTGPTPSLHPRPAPSLHTRPTPSLHPRRTDPSGYKGV